jgi:hypothetical protein
MWRVLRIGLLSAALVYNALGDDHTCHGGLSTHITTDKVILTPQAK